MIKSWLVHTMAPFCGTDQYYRAYSESDPCNIDEVNDWFWNEETINLWDSYSFYNDSEYAAEFEELGYSEDDIEAWEEFIEDKIQEWKENCTIDSEECSEEDFQMYVPGGVGELEIIYDERK